MRKALLFLFCIFAFSKYSSQWTALLDSNSTERGGKKVRQYSLDLKTLRSMLSNAQPVGYNSQPVLISMPTLSGKMEKFEVYSFPIMEKSLAEQYQLGSYIGYGVDDPYKRIRFSVSPNDFQSMIMSDTGEFQFIDPSNTAKTIYDVHAKTIDTGKKAFICSTSESAAAKNQIQQLTNSGKNYAKRNLMTARTSDQKYRTLRLAISVTGEYTVHFGGTAGAMAAINATLTRVNGIYERDFAVHLNLQNLPGIIFTNPSTDPYSDSAVGTNGAWNKELMNVLHGTTYGVGDDKFDIGHLFGGSGGGGNAGCLGCICSNDTSVDNSGAPTNYKGSAYTSPSNGNPSGDSFDIDYVCHEMGHQLGAYHTFSYVLENNGMEVEPGSGSTIMGYAGITNGDDVQTNSDPYFHSVSIGQVQSVLTKVTCDIETPITNTPPVISQLPSYTIPKSTAFVLTGSAADAQGDPMTYCWEQIDVAGVPTNSSNLGTLSSGPDFRSWLPTTSTTRYFPKLSTVLGGALKSKTDWEAVSTVPRTTTFSFTVRDNNPTFTSQQTASSNQTITVGNDGPFEVLTKNTYYTNATTPINWSVANTSASPYNVSAVKIDYTKDNGATWTVLSASTPNDGSENLDLSAISGTIIIRISAINNVFYAVSSSLTAGTLASCTGSAPANISITSITESSANVSWSAVSGATYVVQYKASADTAWKQLTANTNSISLTGLTELTQYDLQVAAVCSGVTGTFSATQTFMTLEKYISYCASSSADSSYEFISNVKVGSMSNTSSATTSSSYSDYTDTASALISLANTTPNNTISVSKSWNGDPYSEAVSAWIDWNRDGTFDSSEQILNSALSKTTPVTANFTIPITVALNVPLRMRVILSDENITSACGTYNYGETEDYKVIVSGVPLTLEDQPITVYPNPTSSTLTVNKVSATCGYQIFAMNGDLVKTGNLENNVVDVSKLASALYVIKLNDNGNTYTFRFIKH